MLSVDLIKTFVAYHVDMTRRVWDSINQISEEQFLADDAYSRGSIRNLMVHLAATDSNWLAGLKNIPEDQDKPGKKLEDYSNRAIVRKFWDNTAKDVADYAETLTEAELG
ncbi:MAG TPA: DinB family protein, partial [Anaerolineales bacterium]|nr:DinB family protein [Anaerolineales bacterium]